MQRVLVQFVAPMAQADAADVAITSNPTKTADIVKHFEARGYHFRTVSEDELPSYFGVPAQH